MENFIRFENDKAYKAAYKIMYPKEYRTFSWDEIKREKERVLKLNSDYRRPHKAADIETYGSRICDAVTKAVNEVADVIR